jgi:SMODS and SLOG-associating 2TM effector domain 2
MGDKDVVGAGADPALPAATSSTRNIASRDAGDLAWRHNDIDRSLNDLFVYVVTAAERSENWYWQRKTWKARLAGLTQWLAVVLTGFAAILPIAHKVGVLSFLEAEIDSGLLASLLIGSAAALLGIDRVVGFSSGWTRYVLTATAIRSACEEFRMDWTALAAQQGSPPEPEHVGAMIQRAKVFRLAVEALVTKETQDWAVEFRQTMSTLERDLKVQVDQAKADRDKAEQDAKAQAAHEKAEREKAAQPGGIEAKVPNAGGADDFQFQVKLETKDKVVVEEPVSGSDSWTRIGVPAGQYKLTLSAAIKKRRVSSTTVVFVKPGETTRSELSLPDVSGAP